VISFRMMDLPCRGPAHDSWQWGDSTTRCPNLTFRSDVPSVLARLFRFAVRGAWSRASNARGRQLRRPTSAICASSLSAKILRLGCLVPLFFSSQRRQIANCLKFLVWPIGNLRARRSASAACLLTTEIATPFGCFMAAPMFMADQGFGPALFADC
jgi:hypothetical protein